MISYIDKQNEVFQITLLAYSHLLHNYCFNVFLAIRHLYLVSEACILKTVGFA